MRSTESLFFSIILPTYNRSDIIGETIKSVINQTYDKWELIIVDDGSTDNTKEVVEKFVKNDNRIRYIHQENSERSSARNNGILNSSGDYICFIDSDDLFRQYHISKINDAIKSSENRNAIFITGQSILKNGKIEDLAKEKINKSSPDFFFTNTIITGRMAISSKILKEFKFDTKFRISEDTDLWVRISALYPDIVQLNCHTLVYRVHNFNSVNPEKYNAYLERKLTLNNIYKNNKINLDKKLVSKTINNCYFGMYIYYKSNGYSFSAFFIMLRAIIELPNHRLKEKIYLLMTSIGISKKNKSEKNNN
jgi:glycosyltransferase involved in cell wall biosynthesis